MMPGTVWISTQTCNTVDDCPNAPGSPTVSLCGTGYMGAPNCSGGAIGCLTAGWNVGPYTVSSTATGGRLTKSCE
jgi:hypothetical protein